MTLKWRLHFSGSLIFRNKRNISRYRTSYPQEAKMRSARLPAILGSRYGPLLVIQSAVNLLLAVWLYLEYTHNPFMQAYVSNVWAAIWPEIAAGISVVIVAVVVFAFYRTRHSNSLAGSLGSKPMLADLEGANNLARLDVCPFCETPLKPISEGRLQCRKCRRYFKSGLPRMAA